MAARNQTAGGGGLTQEPNRRRQWSGPDRGGPAPARAPSSMAARTRPRRRLKQASSTALLDGGQDQTAAAV
jgi:hypothetical protein